jgi:hypothetical protein
MPIYLPGFRPAYDLCPQALHALRARTISLIIVSATAAPPGCLPMLGKARSEKETTAWSNSS